MAGFKNSFQVKGGYSHHFVIRRDDAEEWMAFYDYDVKEMASMCKVSYTTMRKWLEYPEYENEKISENLKRRGFPKMVMF